ncbi:MAG: hypothetical protein CO099_09795 [Bdellovibrio sp. CG_4_9_14_3_um_filter_39_7]|nr:MAG: hypothetical protein CO099_09795 [Bdellovibrio sp. CG_4_9_14_3_um_filter_39_7]
MKYNKYFPLLIALVACQSSSLVRPPQKDFISEVSIHNKEQVERQDLTEGERLASSYTKAKLFTQEKNFFHACARFKYLASYNNFPLKDLAAAQSLKVCSFSRDELKTRMNNLFETSPQWLAEELSNIILPLAQKNNLYEEITKAALVLSQNKKIKMDQEKYMALAVASAQRTKNQELINNISQLNLALSPRFKSSSQPEDWFAMGRDFEKMREFSNARKYYWKTANNDNLNASQRYDAFERWKNTYKLDRDTANYLKKSWAMYSILKKWSKKDFSTWNSYKIDAAIAHARAVWTKNQRNEGEKILLQLIKENNFSLDQKALTYFVLGSMELEKKQSAKALTYFSKVEDLDIKDKDLKNNILWNIGWIAYTNKDYKKATEKFSLYSNTTDDYYFKIKTLFWWAKALDQQKLRSDANRIYEKLQETDPYGFYGLIGSIESGLELEPIRDSKDDGLEDTTLDWLIVTGERDLARNYLDYLFQNVSDYSKIKDLLPLYRRAQHYDGGMTQFFKIPSDKRNDFLEDHIETVFPIAYQSEIATHCGERFGVEPALVKAIIRQESAFNTYIRSSADAFGLMQMIPEKAAQLSRGLKIPYKKFQDLYDPSINLPLGCALLKDHLSDYDNNIIITAASYNAGENVVKNWLKSRFDGDYLEFIESIPYEETKTYVKLILRNLMVYKRIDAKKKFKTTLQQLIHVK